MVAIPSTTPLSGLVKAVPSGDTLLLMKQAAPVNGPPPEMRLTLSSLKAPLLSRDAVSDEPYAWASREYLRQKLIGKVVTFRIDYRVQSLNRIFATVFLAEGGSINLDVAAAGMARVKRPLNDSGDCSPEFEALLAAEDKAAANSIGLHAGGSAPISRRVPQPNAPLLDGEQLVTSLRGRHVQGIVEYVANGSALKVLLKNVPCASEADIGDRLVTMCFSGVQCPGFRRADPENPSSQSTPMPFAVNARFLTEVRLLHRDVVISTEGVDRNGILFATIEDPNAKLYIGEELLRAGFAKTVSWSIDLSAKAPALRAAERSAMDRQVGVWKGFKRPTVNSELFNGTCVEIVSGDMIVVRDDNTGKLRRISLASVRANRLERGARDKSTVTVGPASEARDALRKKLIGKRVTVKIEYTRAPSDESLRKETMHFATVGREGDQKNTDVALPLISAGLLAVVRHRGEEDRAANYEEYLERQKAAVEAKRGIHSNNENVTRRINNLTGQDAKKRSRDVLSGLQRNGPYRGLVEYVSNASRFRVFLSSESMLITLALRAVRCPQPTRRSYAPDGSVTEEVAGEPHGDEALDFARDHIMQRDVEVEVVNVDRVGAFIGNMQLISPSGEKTDVSSLLLEHGHGYIHPSFDPSRDPFGNVYGTIEKRAREAKKGLWRDYVEQSEAELAAAEQKKSAAKNFIGVVCEIGFGGKIYVQNRDTSKSALSTIESGLKSMSLESKTAAPIATLRQGQIVAAKFSADQCWYRARVLYIHKTGEIDVRFVDYGNEGRVTIGDVRSFNTAGGLASAAPIAVEVALGNVVVPDADDACGIPAGEFLRDMIYGKEVNVSVYSMDGPAKAIGDILVPTPGGSDARVGSVSVREEILKAGLARIIRKRDRASKAAFNQLRPFEQVGIDSRAYLWNYGEAYESDFDEDN
ncbi:Ribonuclease TUDOR 2 [Gracilariopsis chorda]|uniref:Ribonuclease TUDOR 2 n=1 Tax=Gracilariopsis chorda TaxID=448386 RepID=A0A2V3IX73_9FLOR|nr:Ribonuclease TUDOR 2 [Gracilariopsis chorda]|eukprot:PXF46756.1 Ribonuclease TUDOR 2 [Gracilariopsis chorda]